MVVAVVDLIKINTHLQKSIEELQTIENHRDCPYDSQNTYKNDKKNRIIHIIAHSYDYKL